MSDDWHFMTATLLKDGAALLNGGYANSDLGTKQTGFTVPEKIQLLIPRKQSSLAARYYQPLVRLERGAHSVDPM
jgi:hypothetical protein